MAAILRRALPAFRAPLAQRVTQRTGFAQRRYASEGKERQSVLAKGAKRDPELYILLTIMSGAFGLVGWHFSRNPTSSSSEHAVAKAHGSEPWNTGSDSPYQFHPHGDVRRPKKDAPSALNEVIVPNVNLPKELHEKYNKWGKEGY